MSEAYRVLKKDTAIYAFAHWTKWRELSTAAEAAGFSIKNMIVLNKSNHGMGDLSGSYSPKYELLMFATKGRHICRWPAGRQNDVWDVPVVFSGAHKFHPNEKPISWMNPAIYNSSDSGQLVFDPFMGSGSTGVAAIKAGRQFLGIEKDKTFFDIAVKRTQEAVDEYSSKVDFSVI